MINFFKKTFLKSYVLIFFLVLPSVVWVFLDKASWTWDQSEYGNVSINLYYELSTSISSWYNAMLSAFSVKAPGIAWLGQFFVPLGNMLGIDIALMLLILIAQFLILIMAYQIINSATDSKKISVICVLIMASAPMFIALSHQFLVEMLQLLAVTIFVYILVLGKKWTRYEQVLALVVASSFALLIKITSPLYVIIPGFFIIVNIFKSSSADFKNHFLLKKKMMMFYLLSIPVVFGTIRWYLVNGEQIIKFMSDNTSGSTALLYSKKVSFFSKLAVWLGHLYESFFIPSVAITFGALVIFFIIVLLIKKVSFQNRKVNIIFAISSLSVVLLLIIFSLQVNDAGRFVLPSLIYVVIIISGFLYYVKSNLAYNFIIGMFLFQFLYVNAFSFGFIKIDAQKYGDWGVPIQNDPSNRDMIKSVVKKTCTSKTKNKTIIIGVEYKWLNANSLNYYLSQNRSISKYRCRFTSLGYAATDVEKTWNNMISQTKPPYFIAVSQELYEKHPDVFNVVSLPILEKVEENNSLFAKVDNFDQPKIQLFKAKY